MTILIPIVENRIKNVDTPYGMSLYEIERKTILQYVCESLLAIEDAKLIFIISKADKDDFHLDEVITMLVPEAKVVISEGKTAGSVCSCLLAIDYLEMDKPLIVVGGDQLHTIDLNEPIMSFKEKNSDGGVVIFDNVHPRWSYVKLDDCGYVIEAAEKRPISRNAATGFYYFKEATDFVKSAISMIKKEASVNGNYYVCPVYNEMILEGKKISVYSIDNGQYFNFNHGKGLELYESYLKSKEIGKNEKVES